MGLYTPTILGGNSYLSWFYDRGAIKDPAHTGTSKGLSQAINRGPIRKFLPKYANVYVTIQSHGLSAGAWSHYVTANGVRDGLPKTQTANPLQSTSDCVVYYKQRKDGVFYTFQIVISTCIKFAFQLIYRRYHNKLPWLINEFLYEYILLVILK